VVVEQKVASMAPLQIKSYLLGPILNNFQKGLGWTNLQFHFLILHHEFGNSFYSKFWHINQKKFMKQKRQLIDHWVASRGPFLRFLLHFRDKSFFMTTGATLVRYGQPSEGSASPPWLRRAKPAWLMYVNTVWCQIIFFPFFWHKEATSREFFIQWCFIWYRIWYYTTIPFIICQRSIVIYVVNV